MPDPTAASMQTMAPLMEALHNNKPPMPAHDYATQWARDTLSGRATGGRYEWGNENLARSYLNLRNIIRAVLDADERGQGIGYSEAMEAAKKAIEP